MHWLFSFLLTDFSPHSVLVGEDTLYDISLFNLLRLNLWPNIYGLSWKMSHVLWEECVSCCWIVFCMSRSEPQLALEQTGLGTPNLSPAAQAQSKTHMYLLTPTKLKYSCPLVSTEDQFQDPPRIPGSGDLQVPSVEWPRTVHSGGPHTCNSRPQAGTTVFSLSGEPTDAKPRDTESPLHIYWKNRVQPGLCSFNPSLKGQRHFKTNDYKKTS